MKTVSKYIQQAKESPEEKQYNLVLLHIFEEK